MLDSLAALVALPEEEKRRRGLANTPREIQQQPETWRGTMRGLHAIHSSIASFLQQCGIAPGSGNVPDVILAGAGTSDYIGRALSSLLQQRWGTNVRSVPSTELLISLDRCILPGRPCLLISFSRSGDSSEGVALLELALARYPAQIRHLVVTCNASGAMARMPGAFPIVLDDVVNDRGLAMTSSFTNLIVAGQFLAYAFQPAVYAPLLNGLVTMGDRLLPKAANLTAHLAKDHYARVCFLGSGALQAAAQESSLKVLELNAGRIVTLAESFLGLRHGPMAFLNEETLVCAYVSGSEDVARYELDLLEEIRGKQLAKSLLLVAPRGGTRVRSLTEHVLELDTPPDFPDACRPPVDILVGQLLALFLSIENGILTDTPSGGAISRVVSGVRMY
jgi:tagatose-6-phosphate ketose/aldose isomerase